MVGVVERGDRIERPKDAVGHWSGRGKVEINDFDDPHIAEAAEHQCATLQQHGRFLRGEKLAAKIDGRGLRVGATEG